MTRARHIVEFIKLKALASFQEINDYFNEIFANFACPEIYLAGCIGVEWNNSLNRKHSEQDVGVTEVVYPF